MYQLRNLKSIALLAAITLAGCGEPQEVAVESSPAPLARKVVNVQPVDAPPSVAAKVREVAEIEQAAPFTPPFARRTDLFKRPDASKAAGIVRKRREERSGDVQLKGFVHVDQPRAMLQIDGRLWIAGVGDEKNEIRVAEVAPPHVSLERGGAPIRLSLHDGT